MHKRREFLRSMLAGGLAVSYGIESLGSAADKKVIPATVKILFQGDSVTDGNRGRNDDWNHVMGHGYAYTVASKLWYDFPDKGFYFYNRGISGNQITDLANRWQADTIDIQPDWLSILVGINDTEAYIKGNQSLTAENFEANYRNLLLKTREQLPNTRLILGEPFILPVGRVKDRQALYETEVVKRQQIVRKLAQEFEALFIPYQSAFTKALEKAPADYWIWDGIHPMPAGHELMARLWLEIVGPEMGI
ncbi:MAG TPA: SGNH/GDSL hydrolase family protein [Dyadobacter sp.]|nr:SGNH/GDSL hydrolase family protein [Dyadobacter sp.]